MAKVEMAKDTYSFSNVIILLLFEGTNSININLQTCNLKTSRYISYKSVNQLQLSLFYWNDKKFSRSNGNFFSHFDSSFRCHIDATQWYMALNFEKNYQQLALLCVFSRWQLIKNLAPSTIVWCQCDIRIYESWK